MYRLVFTFATQLALAKETGSNSDESAILTLQASLSKVGVTTAGSAGSADVLQKCRPSLMVDLRCQQTLFTAVQCHSAGYALCSMRSMVGKIRSGLHLTAASIISPIS